MALDLTILTPGEEANSWVAERVRQRPNPLSPLTFIVPSLHSGRALRRSLATTGYANVRTAIVPQIAEGLGAAALAAAGLRPLTPATQDAAIRSAIGAETDVFGPTARHPATIRTLRRLFQRFRDLELEDAHLDHVAGSGAMAQAATGVYLRYRELVTGARLYDRTDLLISAIGALPNSRRLLAEWGDLVLWFPTDLAAAARRFIAALAESRSMPVVLAPSAHPAVQQHFSRQWGLNPASTAADMPAPRLIVALDAAEEVTTVVREIVANMEMGVALYRTAIVYRQEDLYSSLLRDTLSGAGLPYSGLDGRPLSMSMPGKALLALLRMRDRNFDRPSVVEFHGLIPHGAGDDVSVADWERLSREAGVVAGADQWAHRFARLKDETEAAIDKIKQDQDPSEPRIRRLERQLGLIVRISGRMNKLVEHITPPEESTWDALCGWAAALLDEFVVSQQEWDERENEAREVIASEISSLRAASPIENETSLRTFIDSLTEVLEANTQTQGRLGMGVSSARSARSPG